MASNVAATTYKRCASNWRKTRVSARDISDCSSNTSIPVHNETPAVFSSPTCRQIAQLMGRKSGKYLGTLDTQTLKYVINCALSSRAAFVRTCDPVLPEEARPSIRKSILPARTTRYPSYRSIFCRQVNRPIY